MKMLFDLLPVIVFFIVYKLSNIYMATSAAIIISAAALLFTWIKNRRLDYMLLMTSSLVIVLGSITLLLHDDIFIKWKPTAICWAFGLVFLGSQFMGKQPLIQTMLEALVKRASDGDDDIELPTYVWRKLNIAWVIFYFAIGGANIYVIYHLSTNAWVNFKLFGISGLTLVFVICQAVYLSKFMQDEKPTDGQ